MLFVQMVLFHKKLSGPIANSLLYRIPANIINMIFIVFLQMFSAFKHPHLARHNLKSRRQFPRQFSIRIQQHGFL